MGKQNMTLEDILNEYSPDAAEKQKKTAEPVKKEIKTERTAPPDKTAKMNHTSDPSGKGNKPILSEQKIVKVLLRLFSFVSSCLRIRNGNRKKKDPSSGRDETQIARKDDQN